jgi:hypothetical protein
VPVIAEANKAAKWTSTQIFQTALPAARPGPSDEPLPLVDALELTIPIAHKDPRRHPRVAARWLLRYLEEVPAIVKASAPALSPRTWYGMPAYAKDGKVVCFFQSAQKFKTRYATFGFSDKANLDKGAMWPTAFALACMSPTRTSIPVLVGLS